MGALGNEGLDTWVEDKSVCTKLAYGEYDIDAMIEDFTTNTINYETRNFDPWGDGR